MFYFSVLHNRTQGRLPVIRKLGPKATLGNDASDLQLGLQVYKMSSHSVSDLHRVCLVVYLSPSLFSEYTFAGNVQVLFFINTKLNEGHI